LRVFKTKDFARFARKEKIEDAALCEAIARADRGLIDAALGGDLIKQRVPRKGQGRSGGFRTLLAYRHEHRAVFLHGFPKNALDNLDDDELEGLKQAAAAFIKLDEKTVAKALKDGKWKEVDCGKEIQE
jgi:hypothetical protein